MCFICLVIYSFQSNFFLLLVAFWDFNFSLEQDNQKLGNLLNTNLQFYPKVLLTIHWRSPGVNFINVLHARVFCPNFGTKNYKAVFWVWIFLAPKYWGKKCASKMLMKLTPEQSLPSSLELLRLQLSSQPWPDPWFQICSRCIFDLDRMSRTWPSQ